MTLRRIEGIIYDPENRYPQREVDFQVGAFKKVVFQDRVPDEKQSAAVEGFKHYSHQYGYKLLFPISRIKRG